MIVVSYFTVVWVLVLTFIAGSLMGRAWLVWHAIRDGRFLHGDHIYIIHSRIKVDIE